MALSKIRSESVDLTDDYAFTGTVSGAGSLILLNKVTLDNSTTASVTFDETYINATYDNYYITIHWHNVTDSNKLAARFLETGGTEISDTNYPRNIAQNYFTDFTVLDRLELCQNLGVGGGGNEKGGYGSWILNMKDSDDFQPSIVGNVIYGSTSNTMKQIISGGRYKGATDVTGGIKFYNHSGSNFATGSEFKLYGMAQ